MRSSESVSCLLQVSPSHLTHFMDSLSMLSRPTRPRATKLQMKTEMLPSNTVWHCRGSTILILYLHRQVEKKDLWTEMHHSHQLRREWVYCISFLFLLTSWNENLHFLDVKGTLKVHQLGLQRIVRRLNIESGSPPGTAKGARDLTFDLL